LERLVKKPQSGPSKLAVEAINLYSRGQVAAAAEVARRALAIKQTDLEALSLLGQIEMRLGQQSSGLSRLHRVAGLIPTSPEAHYNLACALHRVGDLLSAQRHYVEAIRLKPSASAYRNNLGSLLLARKDTDRARAVFEEALRIDPEQENAAINLYGVYRALGALDALEQLTARSVIQWPTNSYHWITRAESLFFLGRFAEAWKCYDWRFTPSTVQPGAQARSVPIIPEWKDGSLLDKSVLIWTEQGPGDEVMYATLIPEIQTRVRKLNLKCSERMRPLFARSYPGVDVFGDVVPQAALSEMDVQASIVSFAKLLRPTVESFGVKCEQLAVDPYAVSQLRKKYRSGSTDLLVGIAWRSSQVLYAEGKTVNLGAWGAIFAVPGVRFVNLQYGNTEKELAAIKAEFGISVVHDPSIDPLKDLDAHAAQIAAMDLVICSSNTVAHFAGALGVHTHCMVPATPGYGLRWYWIEKDGRCVWYRSMRLWRQQKPNDWMDVISGVTLELARAVHARGNPGIGHFLNTLAATYNANSLKQHAIASFNLLASLPGLEAEGLFELGREAKEAGDLAAAREFFDRAASAKPGWAAPYNMSGVVLASMGDFVSAVDRYRRAIALTPDAFEVHNNLGTSLRRLGRGSEAHDSYAKANELQPDHPSILLNLATNLTEIGRSFDAIMYFDQLIAKNPGHIEGLHSRSLALLTSGNLGQGWRALESRLLSFPQTVRPDAQSLPVWAGQPLAGKSVLVWTEQGLGDEVLAMSMVADLMSATERVTILSSSRLIPLFSRSFPRAKLLDRDKLSRVNLRDFDYQMSVAELGAAFRPSFGSFPKRKAYLQASRRDVEELRERYRGTSPKLIVGISWVSANPDIGTLKSIELKHIVQAIAANGSVPMKLVSLQYGDHDDELARVSESTGHQVFTDPSVDAIVNIDRFAAQLSAMDLVITISNTTAHLAGALGIPTVLLLPNSRGRHWYWFRGAEDCKWYPSINYALQTAEGGWDQALSTARAWVRALSAQTFTDH
jgi:Flp pilus assembly protein TadD